MSENEGVAAPILLSVGEAAKRLGLSVSYLNKRRIHGGGPVFVKIGASVKYDPADLVAWVAAQKQVSTSDIPMVTPDKAVRHG